MKKTWHVGDMCGLSLIECRECGDRHAEYVMEVKPNGEIFKTSWASEEGHGHALREFEERHYIEIQRAKINLLLLENRYLRSKLHKLKQK